MNSKQLKKIDTVLSTMTTSGDVAGVNCLVLKDGQEIYYGESGYLDIENKIPVKRDSIFRLYSMSKPITATAVMTLVQEGLLDLNAPVYKYLPTFKNQTFVSGDSVLPVRHDMKIKDLMNMTSGLTYGGNSNIAERETTRVIEDAVAKLGTADEVTTLELANQIGKNPLSFSPGEHFYYGLSADILGAVVEVVSGQKYSDYLSEHIFKPLGMKDTAFYVPAEKQSRLGKVYEKTDDGLKEYFYNNLAISLKMEYAPEFESGGAGLASTLDDYAQFARMLQQAGSLNGETILLPQTVNYLTTADMEDAPFEDLKAQWDALCGFKYANLLRIMKYPGRAMTLSSLGEYGWDGWLGPYFANDPANKITILLMQQLVNAGTTEYTRRIRNIIYSSLD